MLRSDIAAHLKAIAGFSVVALAVTSCIGVSAHRTAKRSSDSYFIRTCPGEIESAGPAGLIDDFEDGNTQVVKRDGRGGYCWRSTDSDGSRFDNEESKPSEEGCSGSKLCWHQWGQTASKGGAWGVNFGCNIGAEGTIDLSNYVGLSFRAKSRSGVGHKVRFKIADINTHPNLGVCKDCWNHWGKDILLTNEWREYRVLFAGVQQAPDWGDPRPPSIDPSRIFSIDFSIEPGQTFDVWVDDIQLLKCK